MIAKGAEEGIALDPKSAETLRIFEPLGQHELVLRNILYELDQVQQNLFRAGVLIQQPELEERMRRMGSDTN